MAKTATVSKVFRSNKENTKGECPIAIRVTKNRETKLLHIGYSVEPKYWDDKQLRVKSTHPYCNIINNEIDSKIKTISERITELVLKGIKYTVDDVIQNGSITKCAMSKTVNEFYEELLQEMAHDEMTDTAATYQAAFSWLIKFCGGEEKFRTLTFDKYNYNLLKNLLRFIRKEFKQKHESDIKDTTLFGYFKNFKALKNKAIRAGVCDGANDDCKNFSLSQFNTNTTKRAVPIDTIKSIQSLQFDKGTSKWIARNFFLFSFYARGINLIDMAYLHKKNISEDVLEYTRRKNGHHYKFKLPQKALDIIHEFSEFSRNGYLFPVFDDKEKSNIKRKNKVRNFTSLVNEWLDKIAKSLNIESNKLTFYVARHSYATGLKKSGVPISEISELMGHESVDITKVYLEHFDPTHLAECDNKLFSQLSD
jgi:integrase